MFAPTESHVNESGKQEAQHLGALLDNSSTNNTSKPCTDVTWYQV